MPRHAKGPRLYLRRGRVDSKSGKAIPDTYFIRDGARQVGTGCGPERLGEAERQLADYIAAKWSPPEGNADSRGDPAQVLVSDVVALYAIERVPELMADPKSTTGFVKHLLGFWAGRMLSEVRRSTCKEYVAFRTSQTIRHAKSADGRKVSDQTARRELETLSAAIGYWHGEDTLTTRPEVWLPEKPESPRDALTRSQAAALLKAAMGYRKGEDGRWKRLQASSVANRKHLRRFLLLGFYTGTRHTVMTRLLWSEAATAPWVDVERGVVWRRGKGERVSATKKRPMVKLPPRLKAHMRRWQEKDADLAKKLERPVNNVLHRGGQEIRGKIRTGFAGIVRDAGLDAEITPHWLRHTAATWLMQGGADVWDAAGYLGMTPTTLEKHYGHHRPDHQAGAHKALGRR